MCGEIFINNACAFADDFCELFFIGNSDNGLYGCITLCFLEIQNKAVNSTFGLYLKHIDCFAHRIPAFKVAIHSETLRFHKNTISQYIV